MTKPTIDTLSIQPSFYCNYNCEYCYLGNLRKDKQILDLDTLTNMLDEVLNKYDIKNISLYGGEISLLTEEYLNNLINICKNKGIIPSIITNLSNDWLIDYCDNNNYPLSISLNEERPNYEYTLNKLKSISRKNNKNLSIVVLPSLLNKPADELLKFYDELGFNIFFIQYHPSILSHKHYNVSINDFSSFLQRIIEEKHKRNYNIRIENELILNDDTYNPTMYGCMFITPLGQYSSVVYENGIEHYKLFNSLDEWENMCQKEYQYYFSKCCFCEYFGKCKAEHLETIDSKECSGLYNLLKWYKTNILKK